MLKTQLENTPLIWIRPEQLGSQPSSGGLPGYYALPNVNRGVGDAFGTSKLLGTTNLPKPSQKDAEFEEILQMAKDCFPNAEGCDLLSPRSSIDSIKIIQSLIQ